MTTRRRGDAQWREMTRLLHRHVQPLRMTLDAAQRLMDAARDVPLTPDWIQAVMDRVLARWPETRLVYVPLGESELLFCAETALAPTAGLVELPRLIGVDARSTLGVTMTRIRSDAVDVWAIPGWRAGRLSESSAGPTDPIVFEVSLDCASLEGAHGDALGQCVLRWDICLHAENVDVSHISSQFAAWSDRAALGDLVAAQFERN